MHDLLKSPLWSHSPWSSTVSQPKRREHGHLHQRSAAAEGIQTTKKVLTGRKLAIEKAVMTTCDHSMWVLPAASGRTRLAALQQLGDSPTNSLANTVQGAQCREWCWLVLEKLQAGVEECGSGMAGSSSKVHGDTIARQKVDIGCFCKKTLDGVQWHFGMVYATFLKVFLQCPCMARTIIKELGLVG